MFQSLTSRLRLLKNGAVHFRRQHSSLMGCLGAATRNSLDVLRSVGIRQAVSRFKEYCHNASMTPPFLRNTLSAESAMKIHQSFARQPLVSIVVPVYKVEPRWLDLCIRSVVVQHYERWELILVDDCSQSSALTELMHRWQARDERIQCVELTENQHISRATNAGLAKCQGDYIGFLDHDDELTPDALTWCLSAFDQYPNAKWVYSDEAIVDEQGFVIHSHLKPSFSAEYLLGMMFSCHLSLYAAETVQQVGGLREGFEGSQDHDFALRLSEVVSPREIIHVPRVLYRWRAISGSSALSLDEKSYAPSAGRKAVAEALERRGISAEVKSHPVYPTYYQLTFPSDRDASLAIVVDGTTTDDVGPCLRALLKSDLPSKTKITVLGGPVTKSQVEELQQEWAIEFVQVGENLSSVRNEILEQSKSEFVGFINGNLEVQRNDWCSQMVGTMRMNSDIAAVGAKLLYPHQAVQHCGVIFCPERGPVFPYQGLPHEPHQTGHGARVAITNEYSAVSGDLILVRRNAVLDVGGFDEEQFPSRYADFDLCLRLRQAGGRCLIAVDVEATWRTCEGLEPGEESQEGLTRFQSRWSDFAKHDPYYNPNFETSINPFHHYRDYPVETRHVGDKLILDLGPQHHVSTGDGASTVLLPALAKRLARSA